MKQGSRSITNRCNDMSIGSTLNIPLLRQLVGTALLFLFITAGCTTPPPKPAPTPDPTPIPVLHSSLLEGQTTVTGSGIPNGTVDVFLNGSPVAKGTTAVNGTFDLKVPPLTVKQMVSATQTVAGQTSSHSIPVLVEKTTLTQIEIHPVLPLTIEQGQTLSFTAKGLFSNARTEDPLPGITWSIKNSTVATINAEGIVKGVKGGATTIQANRDEIRSPTVTVKVKPQPPVITAALKAGDTTVHGTSTPSASIKIMINEIPLRTQILADAQGQWEATNLPSMNENDQVTSIQLVNTVPGAPSIPKIVGPPVLTQIAIHPASSAIVEQEQTQQFTASGTFSNERMENPMPKVTWAIENPTVATINAEGTVTGIEAGTTTVKATRDGVQSASATLTVQPQPPVVTSSLNAGATIVAGTASPTANIQILKNGVSLGIELLADPQGHWQANGLPPLNENDRVTGTQLVNGIQSAPSVSVAVGHAILTKIDIQPTPTTILELGQAQQFTATGTLSDGQIEDPLPGVTWLSENSDVATVGADGMVNGLEAGTSTIQATYEGVQSAKATITVKPTPPIFTSSLKAGDTIVTGSAAPLANIQIVKNGVPIDTQILADAQGHWQASGLPPLIENDQVTATQKINSIHSKPSKVVKVPPNNSPVLDPIGHQTVAVGETLKIPINAIDPEGNTLSFEVMDQPLPANSFLDKEKGLFTFTPSTDQVGESTLTFKVSDGYASQQETITVKITLPKSLVVLLDNPDGTVGMIQVANAVGAQTLDKAGQAIGLGSPNVAPSEPFILKKEDLGETFKDALEAKPEEPVKYLLYFETDTKLSPVSEEKLPEIISTIISRTAPDIGIIGHSDRAGSDEYNYQLSLRRATAVLDIFNAKGIKPELMKATSHGENDPIVKTPDGVNEPLNRRVEIIVR